MHGQDVEHTCSDTPCDYGLLERNDSMACVSNVMRFLHTKHALPLHSPHKLHLIEVMFGGDGHEASRNLRTQIQLHSSHKNRSQEPRAKTQEPSLPHNHYPRHPTPM